MDKKINIDWKRIRHLLKLGIVAACMVFGVIWIALMRLIGDYAIINALAAAWISVGNLWMMGGLLIMTRRFVKS